MQLLERMFLGNTVEQYLSAAVVTVVGIIATRVMLWFLNRRVRRLAEQTENRFDNLVVNVVAETRMWVVVVLSLCAGTLMLDLPDWLEPQMPRVAFFALCVQIGIWTSSLINYLVRDYQQEKRAEGDVDALPAVQVLGAVLRAVVWTLVLLVILDNLGVDVTALVTGLGIGGIAVALAVQSVLSDFIAAVLILVDKPFVVGDFIVVGDHLGTVESIGIKTTRLKSLGGESLIFPNSDLVKARIRNYRTLRERRISFNIAVVHDTAAEQVAAIPQLIRETVEELDTIRFDRAHFKGPDDGSLLFEVVYFVLDPDFALFMDRQQSISLGIMRRFAERGIELALPTRKVLLPGPSVTPPQP